MATATSSQHWVCLDCDWVVTEVSLVAGQQAQCPRCQHVITKQGSAPLMHLLAYSITALVLLVFALQFPFLALHRSGLHEQMWLLDSVTELVSEQRSLLSILVLLTTLVLPALYLLAALMMTALMLLQRAIPWVRYLARVLVSLRRWLMADVFLIGALISIVKLSSYASVSLQPAFYFFSGFVVVLLLIRAQLDEAWLWQQLPPLGTEPAAVSAKTAHQQQGVGCVCCHAFNRNNQRYCWRCGEWLALSRWRHPLLTLALLLAATAFLVPANVLPMIETLRLGQLSQATITGGVIQLWQQGDQPIAAVIFIASLVIPIAKILLLLGLLYWSKRSAPTAPYSQRMRVFRLTEWVGRWSMIDIFVVAILIALVRLGALMSIYSGAAALAFASVVVLTMLAAMSFDRRRIWWAAEEAKSD
ncbi:paraquat-inducible protein A [Idiomarina tyrosinivorans]|uniref:Paraquat-inducible protein A n=1 Tax=Idiomarina tyrosinivorans TaxID=1445662 RepID=A0A432ZPE0_9GAMM|nr:PqiA/YebS family transporter subunit [Idiomarina tyrosinivorans]RUO79757.1 paraquat-inducible protein A [Idiomarina tyrosinivorans]